MIIAIDFDGTVVTHMYPYIGEDIGAVPTLKRIIEAGHQIILWTMRDKKELAEAVEWFKEREIPLYGINENPEQNWSDSNKQYAHMYIDDTALGCPLRFDAHKSSRPFVNWEVVTNHLERLGVI